MVKITICNSKTSRFIIVITSDVVATISNVSITTVFVKKNYTNFCFRYRWAFVGDNLAHVSTNYHEQSCFIPHVVRIANLMDQKFTDTQIETLPTKQNELLLTVNSINQLKDLHGFFKTLSLCSNRHRTECSGSIQSDHLLQDRQIDKKMSAILEKVDKVVDMDFLEKIVR